jgi:hypothetical protein
MTAARIRTTAESAIGVCLTDTPLHRLRQTGKENARKLHIMGRRALRRCRNYRVRGLKVKIQPGFSGFPARRPGDLSRNESIERPKCEESLEL